MQSVLLTSLTLRPPRAMGCRLSQPHPTFKRVLGTHTQVSVIVYIMHWATSPAPKPKCLTQNISVTLQAPHLDLQSHPGIPLLLWHLSVSKQQKKSRAEKVPKPLGGSWVRPFVFRLPTGNCLPTASSFQSLPPLGLSSSWGEQKLILGVCTGKWDRMGVGEGGEGRGYWMLIHCVLVLNLWASQSPFIK